MDRRQFVTGAAGAGTALTLATSARAQSGTTLRIASVFGTGPAGRAATAADLTERVAVLSGGGVTIEVSDASSGTGSLVDALDAGQIDGVIATQDLFMPLSQAFGLFSAVPGGMMERELEAWIRSDTGQERWDALAAEHGFKPFYLGDSGGEMLWSSTALDNADAVSGLQVAARGLSALAWTRAGADVVAATDYASFPQEARAYETGPLNEQYQSRDRAPNQLYLDTPTRPSGAVSLTMSLSGWEGLDTETQQILTAAITAVTYRTNARAMQANALAHQALRLNSGLTIAPLPLPTWTALMDASRSIYDEMDSLDGEARRAWRAYTRFARDVQNWTRLSEAAFTTARARNVPA